jgi:hypothetical protein
MSLHIFLDDELLLYFIVRVEVIKIQIWFEFKLVCSLQKCLKIYKGFSIFLRRIGPNSRSRPSLPPPHAAQLADAAAQRSTRRTPTQRREPDPITPNLT